MTRSRYRALGSDAPYFPGAGSVPGAMPAGRVDRGGNPVAARREAGASRAGVAKLELGNQRKACWSALADGCPVAPGSALACPVAPVSCSPGNQRGWSQEQLADESKISKTQISRWERDKLTKGIRQSSRDRLCKALGVKWEDLTRPPKDEDTLKWRNRVPLKCGIDGSARTFLTAVKWNLGLTEEAVFDLAPLAVLILAYQSLRARQTALDEAIEAVEAATAEAHRRLPYMPGAFHDGFDYDWIQEERTSLDEREVFMTHQDDEGNEYSPFSSFLENQLKTLGLFKDDPVELTCQLRRGDAGLCGPRSLSRPGPCARSGQ
jgi:transcriptional regulator with XRE-family HTH domain